MFDPKRARDWIILATTVAALGASAIKWGLPYVRGVAIAQEAAQEAAAARQESAAVDSALDEHIAQQESVYESVDAHLFEITEALVTAACKSDPDESREACDRASQERRLQHAEEVRARARARALSEGEPE